MTSMKELCEALRPGESISIDRSEGGFSIRASLEGKVVFSNHVHLDLLDDARFDLTFRIILDSIAEVRQFRTEQEKPAVPEKLSLNPEGMQVIAEGVAGAYRRAVEREAARRLLLEPLTEEQREQYFARYPEGIEPTASTELLAAYERKAEEMSQAMQQRVSEWD